MRKKKRNTENQKRILKEKILTHTNKIKINDKLENKQNLNIESFSNNIYVNHFINSENLKFDNNVSKEETYMKCKKIILLPNKNMKLILINWFNDYRLMYNETIKYFNSCKYNKTKPIIDFKKIRTNILKEKKNIIRSKNKVPSHTLDYAIKDACAMYKSALSNIKNKNINHFRLRYIKSTKKQHFMTFEKTCFSKNNFMCKTILKQQIKNKSDFDYSSINCDSKLIYNQLNNIITLLVPIKKNVIDNIEFKNENSFISIDPGLRTYLTCLTNNNIIELGTDIKDFIKKNLKKINDYEKILKSNECKKPNIVKKNIIRTRLYLLNKIEDMQWKTCNYLTSNYKNIIIGNWSTKNCVQGKINKNVKNEMMYLGHYKFIMRLQYKCDTKKTNLIIIDEAYTSKSCSSCSNMYEIGSSKVYNCTNCNLICDRDINSTKNILCRAL